MTYDFKKIVEDAVEDIKKGKKIPITTDSPEAPTCDLIKDGILEFGDLSQVTFKSLHPESIPLNVDYFLFITRTLPAFPIFHGISREHQPVEGVYNVDVDKDKFTTKPDEMLRAQFLFSWHSFPQEPSQVWSMPLDFHLK